MAEAFLPSLTPLRPLFLRLFFVNSNPNRFNTWARNNYELMPTTTF